MSSTPPPPPSGPWGDNPKAQAKAAKAYAKASRPWFKKKRFIIPLALVVLAVAGSALGGGGSDADNTATDTGSDTPAAAATQTTKEPAKAKASSKPAKAKETKAAPEQKAVAVRAGVILQQFEDNELSADAKYKDQDLKISGVVDSIDTDLFDDEKYILRIGTGSDFEILTVNCNDMSTDELSTLNKGDNVTVFGEFDDGGDLGVEVKDCSLA